MDRYLVTQRIGDGSYGEVLLATNRQTQEKVWSLEADIIVRESAHKFGQETRGFDCKGDFSIRAVLMLETRGFIYCKGDFSIGAVLMLHVHCILT